MNVLDECRIIDEYFDNMMMAKVRRSMYDDLDSAMRANLGCKAKSCESCSDGILGACEHKKKTVIIDGACRDIS
jgi:hypothetical protein